MTRVWNLKTHAVLTKLESLGVSAEDTSRQVTEVAKDYPKRQFDNCTHKKENLDARINEPIFKIRHAFARYVKVFKLYFSTRIISKYLIYSYILGFFTVFII